ncbi:hypothetical protein BRE01_42670 [Brevibacillus reuszeri]|uniref:Uncharacterized protein n=1 Tax=Brevibacillus reuszeri TaxID=54915 RepID=A0ABQ0TS01_9BACL|nr:hypothetical protein BRE01_42670 [Brevibacillus reuszeri]
MYLTKKAFLDTSYYTSDAIKSLEQKADEIFQNGSISGFNRMEKERTPSFKHMLAISKKFSVIYAPTG